MTSYLMKKKGEEGISGKAADSFLTIHFANDRHFECPIIIIKQLKMTDKYAEQLYQVFINFSSWM